VKAREDNEKCLELILRSYARHWDELPRRYFEEHARRWIACRHYFLSFTNRNRSVVGQSQVNRNHEYFIVDVLTRPSFEQGDRLRRNLLAQAVHCLLQNEQLEGFYFPEHEGDNSVVEIKLRDNCERALAFVQLVQGEMFRHYEDKKNWCHFEYSVAQRVDSGRILFVQIDDEIPSDDISIEFEPWYRAFTRRDVPRLDWTRRADEPGVEANFKTIRRIAMDIRRIIDRVYVNIPH
jgi:hypothetical protein